MDRQSSSSVTFITIDQKLALMSSLLDKMQSYLNETRSAAIPSLIYEGVSQLANSLDTLSKKIHSLEDERRDLLALAQIGQVTNSSLDLGVVLQIVMDTIIRLTGAERGFLMLKDENDNLNMRVARNWEQESLKTNEGAISTSIIKRVIETAQPVLTTNAQEDPRFTGQDSIVAYNLRSIICVPLIVKGKMTGVIYADNRIRSGIFSQKQMDLLQAFANQAAGAIENASLFVSVSRSLAEVTQLKNLMDNIFASIASGVLITDSEEKVILCNRAAAFILGQEINEIIGQSLREILDPAMTVLKPYLKRVLENDSHVLGLEASMVFNSQKTSDLRFSFSPLKDTEKETQGVAIVLDDLTEQKRLERKKLMFERMVSPAVIDQLDSISLALGGKRAEITIMFADIRGFTSFSEGANPEQLVSVLNRYLASAAEAVLNEEGTVDKFLGDAVMAWFNAPIPQQDHTLRAVRAALNILKRQQFVQRDFHADMQLSFGVGIHCGDAVLGLVGTERRLEYTAIGDSVNTAKRIQENAAPGQILISHQALQFVKDKIEVMPVDPIQAKGKKEPLVVYEVIRLI